MNIHTLLIFLVLFQSSILISQAGMAISWMLYAWNKPENLKKIRSPNYFKIPKYSFTALIPARHEEKVIQDTINAVNAIDYPNHLKEILVILRSDDTKTINRAQKSIFELQNNNIKLIILNGTYPINKPHSLNHGLSHATKDIVCVFDAEDEPHRDIYNVINTTYQERNADVVQSGVQLINYRSSWFSTLNVLEYYLWFKSGLNFFTNIGNVTPLGGNTVFLKRNLVNKIGGWDENNLTEDADIGIRSTIAGAKTVIVYDEEHATREETPSTTLQFIKQRTRWNQGFLQIIAKGDWLKLPKFKQKIVVLYILLSPFILTVLMIYTPLGIFVAINQQLPIIITLVTFIPLFLLFILIAILNISLYDFTKNYKLKYSPIYIIYILVTFFPYQLLLIMSSLRAIYRFSTNLNSWEKTLHINAHREGVYIHD
jgi:glycosyltransferase XagB